MSKTIIFDLDDTLYSELEFVRSGFAAVGDYLCSKYQHLDRMSVAERMEYYLRVDGRGRIFDQLLRELRLDSRESVASLVSVYRSHQPAIHLYEDVRDVLSMLRNKGFLLGLITDGMAAVQRIKIEALQVRNEFDLVICTDELAPGCAKPSTVPFEMALQQLKISAPRAFYVGDNCEKDFSGPHALGMRTIRIIRPEIRVGYPPSAGLTEEAQYQASGLREVLTIACNILG